MRTISIGRQDYAWLIEQNCFYVDKTYFIKDWWDSKDDITLITRPRRFGKTLNMSMLECFFSTKYENRPDLFQGLSVWEDEKIRAEQGAWPVINLSFANVKKAPFSDMKESLFRVLANAMMEHKYLLESDRVSSFMKDDLSKINTNMSISLGRDCINSLCNALYQHYGKKALIFLDEYDTPIQEAWIEGCYDEMVDFIRSLFNSSFKTNPHLQSAVITGITRVSKESIFSDMNNLEVCTVTSDKYATAFGFTENEVLEAIKELGMDDEDTKAEIKQMYDGFTFGNVSDIYNPWSLTNYFENKKPIPYWANSSGNALVGKLFLNSGPEAKQVLENLINKGTYKTKIDEQASFNTIMEDKNAIWSLLLAAGYLTSVKSEYIYDEEYGMRTLYCELKATNAEVRSIFLKMIRGWFSDGSDSYNSFIKYMLKNDVEAMNHYINNVAMTTFSYMDTGSTAVAYDDDYTHSERFYHGFTLGLLIDLKKDYQVLSNSESGFGRYDVMIIPKKLGLNAYIIEFKVHNKNKEKNLEETADNALSQIEGKKYETELIERGISPDRIYKYGFAFKGKTVLIKDEK